MDLRVLRRKRTSYPCVPCGKDAQRGNRRAEEKTGGCGVWYGV